MHREIGSNLMSEKDAAAVYDLLISIGGAYAGDKDNFIFHHSKNKFGCREWRFQGKLGFGGKYRSETNKVDCYREHETPEILSIIKVLNEKLSKL